MRAEPSQLWAPFPPDASDRVRLHPDTPAAYVRWGEIIPLLNRRWATELGNRLDWSLANANRPVGASHELLRRWLGDNEEGYDDCFMLALMDTPVIDFIDGTLPFLMSIDGLCAQGRGQWLQSFMSGQPGLVPDWPDNVLVELTQSCNFSCVMCSHQAGGFRTDMTMPLPVFGEIVRQFSRNASSFRINGYGESTIIPDLGAYLDCFEEFGYTGHREIITNLSGPTPLYERMIREGYALIVSWDATDRTLFERIRRGADFERQKERLRKLCGLAAPHPEQVVLLCTVQELNLSEIPAVVGFASQAGAGVVIYNMVKEKDGSPWMERRFREIADLFAEAQKKAALLGVDVRLPDHIGAEPLHLAGTCRTSACGCDRPWNEILIRHDLELQPCNMFNPYTYGLLRLDGWELDMGQRFESLWKGRAAAAFRANVNRNPRHPYCDRCYWLR